MADSRRRARALIVSCDTFEGAALGDGAFAPGPAVWAGQREVAHVDVDGTLDIRLTKQLIRERRPELRSDERVVLRASGSDWLGLRVANDRDTEFARSLIRDAVTANLPTAKPGSPPTGTDLERHRRFH